MDAVSLPPLALKGAVLVSFHQCIVEVSITIDYVQLVTSGRAGEAAGGGEDAFAQEGNKTFSSVNGDRTIIPSPLQTQKPKITTLQELQLLPLIIKL